MDYGKLAYMKAQDLSRRVAKIATIDSNCCYFSGEGTVDGNTELTFPFEGRTGKKFVVSATLTVESSVGGEVELFVSVNGAQLCSRKVNVTAGVEVNVSLGEIGWSDVSSGQLSVGADRQATVRAEVCVIGAGVTKRKNRSNLSTFMFNNVRHYAVQTDSLVRIYADLSAAPAHTIDLGSVSPIKATVHIVTGAIYLVYLNKQGVYFCKLDTTTLAKGSAYKACNGASDYAFEETQSRLFLAVNNRLASCYCANTVSQLIFDTVTPTPFLVSGAVDSLAVTHFGTHTVLVCGNEAAKYVFRFDSEDVVYGQQSFNVSGAIRGVCVVSTVGITAVTVKDRLARLTAPLCDDLTQSVDSDLVFCDDILPLGDDGFVVRKDEQLFIRS